MIRSGILLGALALLTVGCNVKKHGVPAGMTQPLDKIDWTILGATNHEECGTYILAIDWAHLFANQSFDAGDPPPVVGAPFGLAGIIAVMSVGRYNPDESRALYHAADKMPDATHLIAPRVHSTSSGILLPGGLPLFGERCASVEARGLKVGTKPAIHYAPVKSAGTDEGTPLLDEEGNPVLDEEGNPVMAPVEEGSDTEAAPQ
jgi:hypothetical protein